MQAKLFEVRDSGTCYSILAVKHVGETAKEQWLLARVGLTGNMGYPVQITDLENGETHRDMWKWAAKGRTLVQAHLYIMKEWDNLKSGDVIDVAFILGETDKPCHSSFNPPLRRVNRA